VRAERKSIEQMRYWWVNQNHVHGGDKTGHWSVGDVLMRAV
jgi:hypothetical protein